MPDKNLLVAGLMYLGGNTDAEEVNLGPCASTDVNEVWTKKVATKISHADDQCILKPANGFFSSTGMGPVLLGCNRKPQNAVRI